MRSSQSGNNECVARVARVATEARVAVTRSASCWTSRALVIGMALTLVVGCSKTDIETSSTSGDVASNAITVATKGTPNLSWPGLLGENQNAAIPGEGYDLSKLDGQPSPIWQVPLGTGYGAPVVDDQQVVVMGRDGEEEFVRSLKLQSGELIWNHTYPTRFECRFEYSSGPYSTPAVTDEHVFAWSAEGVLRCLNRETGTIVWTRDLAAEYEAAPGDFPLATSPALDSDKLFLNVGGGRGESGVVALSQTTGETLWTASTDLASHATPVTNTSDNQTTVFVLGYDFLTAIDAKRGDVLWQREFHANNREMGKFNSTSPLVMGDQLVVAGYAAGGLCLNVADIESPILSWEVNRRIASNQMAPVVATPAGLLTYSSDRKLTCIEPDSGEVVFRERYEFGGEPQWFRCGDWLVVLGMNGKLFVLDTTVRPFAIRFETESPVVTPRCFTTPVAAGGRLLVRGQEELTCFDVSAQNGNSETPP